MKLTNFQLIKEMTKEQLAEFLDSICDCGECPCVEECVGVDKRGKCNATFLKWLEAESEKLCFGDLRVGDKFRTFGGIYDGEFMKTTAVIDYCDGKGEGDNISINTVDLQTGNLLWLPSDVLVERI